MTNTTKIFKAQEFEVKQWIDANGNKIKPIKLSDLSGKYKVIFCFQSWCPGCHSRGFPTLQKMVASLKGNQKVDFLAIQTVFEGFEQNSYDKMVEAQNQYSLKIPFGHDAGDDGSSMSNMMKSYKTKGTPWFIFIDNKDNIVFDDFQINSDAAIEILKAL